MLSGVCTPSMRYSPIVYVSATTCRRRNLAAQEGPVEREAEPQAGCQSGACTACPDLPSSIQKAG
jgi:hypothetical protein